MLKVVSAVGNGVITGHSDRLRFKCELTCSTRSRLPHRCVCSITREVLAVETVGEFLHRAEIARVEDVSFAQVRASFVSERLRLKLFFQGHLPQSSPLSVCDGSGQRVL